MPFFFRMLPMIPVRALATVALVLQAIAGYAQTGSTPLIWEVHSDTNIVYLFGTIHVGARKMYPLSTAVEQAFAASKTLALEADPTDQSGIMAVTQGSTYQPPDTLARHISPKLMEQITKTVPSLGLPIEYARALRPHMLAMTIAMLEIGREGYDPNQGLDIHFAQLAKLQGKQLIELESLAEQMALLNSFSPELQEAMLQASLDSIADGSMKADLAELVSAWRAGDADRLMAQVDKETESLPASVAQDFKARLYDQRNQAMSERILGMLKGSEPTFVAVGTGHLLGPTGIVALLTKRGYEVKKK
ncbi:MAG: hypothetical protein C5B46_07425 [Proteobacteria bacterium]|nr:MAG: hypothetical protein C5B46_07425 [Pseudomonadota bacterium]